MSKGILWFSPKNRQDFSRARFHKGYTRLVIPMSHLEKIGVTFKPITGYKAPRSVGYVAVGHNGDQLVVKKVNGNSENLPVYAVIRHNNNSKSASINSLSLVAQAKDLGVTLPLKMNLVSHKDDLLFYEGV